MTRQQQQWIARLRLLCQRHQRDAFAIGDLYNEGRQAFGPGWCRVLTDGATWSDTGYSTLRVYAWVARRFPKNVRYPKTEFSVYAEAARLPTLDQRVTLVTQAAREGWKTNRTRIEARLRQRGVGTNGTDIITDLQTAIDRGLRFRTILADCPWDWERQPGQRGGTTGHYKTMPTKQIAALCVPMIATHDAMLFMWCPAAGLPDAFQVMAAWGFKYKTHAVATKQSQGTGFYWRMAHEDLLLGVRPSTQTHFDDNKLLSVFEHNRTTHSTKPAIHADIERAHGGPYVELYGRRRVNGWTVYGDQLDLGIDAEQLAAD